jgi:hypothetical protein
MEDATRGMRKFVLLVVGVMLRDVGVVALCVDYW